jgi:chloride channel 2
MALIAFPLPLMRNDTNYLLAYLGRDPHQGVTYWPLALQVVAKFVLTLFSVGFTGAAAGVFGPVFVEGALMGRLFGEVVALLFPSLEASPTAYAIVGAAAFASGVTRTISTAIIVVELTMQVHLLLPVLLAVLLANFFGRMISLSVYSVLIQAKDLPQLPRFKLFSQATSKTAGEIMRTDVQYLHSSATMGEVLNLVKRSDFPTFPLVDSDGFFCGIVRRAKLTSTLKRSGVKLHSSSIGDIGQRVIDRAVKQWDEKNHSIDQTSSMPSHLEPEDLEPGLSVETPSSSTSLIGSLPESNQASFGRKADLARLSTALGDSVDSSMDHSSSPSSSRISTVDSPIPLDRSHSMDPDSILDSPIPFVFNTNVSDTSVIDVDTTVLTISPDTTVTKVHFMFTVLGISHIFVVRRGKLLGLITRKDLIKAINTMNYEKR